MSGAARVAVGLGLAFAAAAFAGIGARQPLTGDEAIILSVSETLVREGRLGAPIFSGVGGAETHYFLSLPLVHLLHWPAMKMFGVDAAPSRAVSLLLLMFGVAVLAIVVAQRTDGVAALMLVLAMLFWRNDLIGVGWGLPAHAVSRSARYDAAQLALLVLTLAWTLRWFAHPSRASSLVLGAMAGASVLTHFLGVIAPAMVLLSWVLAGPSRAPLRQLGWVGLGLLIVVSPYLIFLLRHWPDAVTQVAAVHSSRADAAVGGLRAAALNVLAEPRRYTHLLRSLTPGPMLLMAAVPVVGWWVLRKWSVRDHAVMARASAAYLLVALGLLAAFEPTKAPLYALPLILPIGLVLALASGEAYRTGSRRRRTVLIAVVMTVAIEGLAAIGLDWRASRARRPYDEIAEEIRVVLSPTGMATGATRWWWQLRDPGFVPFVTLQYRATLGGQGLAVGAFAELWQSAGVRYVVRTPEFESDVVRAGNAISGFVNAVIRQCGRQVLHIEDATYGPVDVFALAAPCTALSGR